MQNSSIALRITRGILSKTTAKESTQYFDVRFGFVPTPNMHNWQPTEVMNPAGLQQ